MKLKICGMKYPDNMCEVAQLQPDYLGFIFYDKSSRFFNGTIPELPKSIKKVGVFVNATTDYILKQITAHDLQTIQLHGEESPEFCKELKSHFDKGDGNAAIEIIKVFSIKDNFNFDQLEPFEPVCDYYLFDTKGKLPGGNGYTFNWEVLKNYPSLKPYFLSGGIGLDEIDNLKQFFQNEESNYCNAIDVNSKFEIEAGLKDTIKIKEFKSRL